jgi:hypothetical protein
VSTNTPLKILFCCILAAMLAATGWAAAHQAILHWGGLTAGPDRYWTIATLMDAYCGFLTFYAWVLFKERRWMPRLGWFAAIMLLGNIAMSSYVLCQLMRLRPDQGISDLLAMRNA